MNPELLEYIESYLDGSLSKEELKDRAQALGVNDLQEQIDFVKAVPLAYEIDDVRQQIQHVLKADNKTKGGGGGKIRNLKRINWVIGLAASIAILVGVFWFGQDRSGANTWLESYQFQDPGIPVVMSQSDNYELYDALTYYSEENYTTTIEKLTSLQQNQTSDTISYYLAASYYYSSQENNAIDLFESVADDPDSKFSERAEWFLVLIAVNQDRIEDARSLLEKIAENSGHQFYDKAESLSQSLNE